MTESIATIDPILNDPSRDDGLRALAVLERMRDHVRFRVDGLRPDLIRERPEGFARTMGDVIVALKHAEAAFAAALQAALIADSATVADPYAPKRQLFMDDPFEELGAFLVAREETLKLIRPLTDGQWARKATVGAQTKSISRLVVDHAKRDQAINEELGRMRHALEQSVRAGVRTMTGSRLPDSSQ